MPVSVDRVSTFVGIAHLLARALDSYGLSAEDLFTRAGLTPEARIGSEARISAPLLQRVWHQAEADTGDPCFGITVASMVQPAALHGLGFAWIASDTLFEALRRLAHYYRVLVTAGEVSIEENTQGVLLWWKIPPHGGRVAFSSLDAALALFVQMCRITAGDDLAPTRAELQRPEPLPSTRLHDFFRCPIQFCADENRLYFDTATLSRPLPTANPALARANDEVVAAYLARFDDDVLNRVRAAIVEALPNGVPTQAVVARTLNMSARSLQRRLAAEDSSFTQLQERVRRDVAEQYLREGTRSVGEIAYVLGFSEHTNFTRAFKRWTGLSPKQFRASH